MDYCLDLAIYFVGSGLAFFVGLGSVILGVAGSASVQGRALQLARNLAVLIGGIFVAISAIPLDWWLYGLVATFTLIWLPLEWYANPAHKKIVLAARPAVLAAWLLALVMELPYHFTPTLPPLGNPTLYVIGDSISAGMTSVEQNTWPRKFEKKYEIDVGDFSQMGATVGSARKQVERIGAAPGLVLLEIGGNDLLGSTTSDLFEERLDQLLTDVCRPNRTVILLELPLPPFANRFGQIQRRLAHQHGVILIPRRVLIGVLSSAGATGDGVHLSPAGHELMAETMWKVLRPAYVIAQ
ncbi:MAG: hypothetical protein EXR98_07425 [Gemmataceae bacterium]|nr:hypothetical protein [Gemmataceae bacterium]